MAEHARRRPHWAPDSSRPADDATLQSAREAVQRSNQGAAPTTTETAPKRARFDTRNPSRLAPTNDDDDDGSRGGNSQAKGEADDDLDLDEIGRRGVQGKRRGVELDGYDTDSSDDNFDSRADERAKMKKKIERDAAQGGGEKGDADEDDGDEDEDMFAESDGDGEKDDKDNDEDGEESKNNARKKRTVEFLDDDDIEGQIDSSRAGGRVSLTTDRKGKKTARLGEYGLADEDNDSDDDESDSGDDQTRAELDDTVADAELGAGSKKRHAPRLDAFNMKTEQQEGRFDGSGNFIRNAADPDADHDGWLDGISKRDLKRAREARRHREEAQERAEEEERGVTTAQLLGTLIRNVDKGDTVLETLGRLGVEKKRLQVKAGGGGGGGGGRGGRNSRTKTKTKTKDSHGDVDMAVVKDLNEDAVKRIVGVIHDITVAADRLLSRGMTDVYDTTREAMIRLYTADTGEDWVDDRPRRDHMDDDNGNADAGADVGAGASSDAGPAPATWRFRWTEGPSAGQVQGPYDGPTMTAWLAAGYFANPDAVEFCHTSSSSAGDETWVRGITEFVS